MSLSPGARLGPYEILARLGAGGMGEVYRARDTRLGREVAVKVLPSSVSTDPDRLSRFEQEAHAASALNHPNILAIYDVGKEGRTSYVVSEFLEGETLRDRLAGAALPARKAIEYGIQIADGLAAAHEKGIVHRDLKPENLFVTRDGRVKVLDFGLAKLTRPELSSEPVTEAPTLTPGTEPGVIMGTVGYMSPEQVRGQPADHRADIFSLGAILYEMLSGKRAFSGDSAVETLNAILTEEPAELSRPGPGFSSGIRRIVSRCLEKNPEERFQSARDLAFALREAASDSATASSDVAPSRLLSRRMPWFLSLGVGLSALLVWLVATNPGELRERILGRTMVGRIESIAVLPLKSLSGDREQEYFADGMTEAVISNLARIRALRVISGTSTMQYKGTRKRLPAIARELDVDAVVEGSVLRSGEKVRVTVMLIQAPADKLLWSRNYERALRDVLTLQNEVAQAITREIEVRVSPGEKARLAWNRPVDPGVYDAYLRGRHYASQFGKEAWQKAISYFENAIKGAPTYAPAYVGLAECYTDLHIFGDLPAEVALPKAKEAALRALALDESLAEAHVALGLTLVLAWDWRRAGEEFERALELKPGDPKGHSAYADYLAITGQIGEFVSEKKKARELDPNSVRRVIDLGEAYFTAGDYDRAIGQLRLALELRPDETFAHTTLGLAYLGKGMYEQAIAEMRLGFFPDGSAELAYAYAVSGKRSEARKILERRIAKWAQGEGSPVDIALIYAGLGENDQAFEWLERAFAQHDGGVVIIKAEPSFVPLRSDPRFEDLLRRLGLPP